MPAGPLEKSPEDGAGASFLSKASFMERLRLLECSCGRERCFPGIVIHLINHSWKQPALQTSQISRLVVFLCDGWTCRSVRGVLLRPPSARVHGEVCAAAVSCSCARAVPFPPSPRLENEAGSSGADLPNILLENLSDLVWTITKRASAERARSFCAQTAKQG